MADYDAKWFRSWHGAPTDPKWLVIERRAHCQGVTPGMVSAVAWALMDYASQNTDRGSVAGFDVETYSTWSGWGEDQVQAIIDAMRSKGVITEDDKLAAWDKRQPKREDATATARQQRKRERDRNAPRDSGVTNSDVTHGHAASRDGTTDKIREDKIRIDEGLARPPASSPPPSQEPADPEYGVALSKLESLGMMTGTALLEFQALWPDLNNGHRAWIDDAITVAQANSANSPVYAVRVLANWTKNGRGKPNPQVGKRPQGHNLRELLRLDEDD